MGSSKEQRAFHIWERMDSLPDESRAAFQRDNAELIIKFNSGYVPVKK